MNKKDLLPNGTFPHSPSGLGLALSAGGARGAYQLGCWRAFLDYGISFSAIAGSSIGAFNGALICQNDWNRAYSLWRELASSKIVAPDAASLSRVLANAALDVGLLLLPVPKIRMLRYLKYALAAGKFLSRHGALGGLLRYGVTSMTRLKPLVDSYLNLSLVLEGPLPLFVTVYSLPDITQPLGRTHWFCLQELEQNEAWDVLAASMAVPLVFPPIEFQGKIFTDGGLGRWLPIQPLIEKGFRRIVAVSIRSDVSFRTQDYPSAEILLIKPEKPLGRFPLATFRFTPEAVNAWIEQGYQDTSRLLDSGAVG